VNKNTLCCFNSFLNKVENGISSFILQIKDYLIVLVKPEESEVGDTNWLPVIWDLSTSTIDDVAYFIGYYELNILRSKFISYK
jgi:hypothetical protein